MYEANDVGSDHAPPRDERSIDDESRAQADGATVPYPTPAGPAARPAHARRPPDDALGDWTGRTPW